MSMINFMLSCIEHGRSFLTAGPDKDFNDILIYIISSLHFSHHIVQLIKSSNPFHSEYRSTCTLANSEDSDEMQHKAAFHQGLHCFLL